MNDYHKLRPLINACFHNHDYVMNRLNTFEGRLKNLENYIDQHSRDNTARTQQIRAALTTIQNDIGLLTNQP